MEKFLKDIQETQKAIQTVDYMIYMTFPLIKDKRLLLKIVLELKSAITKCINLILQYEYLHKRITLYQSPKTNFRIFKEQCAPRYKITKQEIELILELFDLIDKHKQSSFEFMKDEKIIILSDDLRQKTFTIETAKEFLILAKNILNKIQKLIL